ncbi:hypothetical protein HYPSUDRAFT_114344, partial [Hypholoma sublateritium FD-334 SS-4]
LSPSEVLYPRGVTTLIKCSIPVFEGLLPEPHNTNVLNVLFVLAHWHALAKLRQHTDLSLAALDGLTTQLGELLRIFQGETCAEYDTRELNRERAARMRQTAGKPTSNEKNPGHVADAIGASKSTNSAGKLRKTLNLNTYKDHSLGDYVESIRRYGTIDSYSTEAGKS